MKNLQIIKLFEYKSCTQVNNKLTGKRHYVTPDGEKLPSVTTILSATKDNKHLEQWKKRVGEDKAKQIVSEAASVGTEMHASLELFLKGEERKIKTNLVHKQAFQMANVIIENGLSKLDNVCAIEQSLYFPGLYAGTTDLIGTYQGNLSIVDFKQSNQLKKDEWVEDYKLQLVSYAMAHNSVYNTNIREGHIFICTRNLEYQQFDLLPKDFNHYRDMWIDRLEQFYCNY